MKIFQDSLFAFSLFFTVSLSAQGLTEGGDDKYKPSIGQEGKDVIWVPTGDELVTNMLKIAKVVHRIWSMTLALVMARLQLLPPKNLAQQPLVLSSIQKWLP